MKLRVDVLLSVAIAAILCLFCPPAVLAQDNSGSNPSLDVYTEVPYSTLPLKSVDSVTKIDGAVAISHIVYTFADGLSQTDEVGMNFHLPQARF